MKLWMRFGLVALTGATLASVLIVRSERTFAPPATITSAKILRTCSTVAVIGDSWVANRALDEPLRASLGTSVISYGYPGAKSRRIYEELSTNDALLNNATVCNVIVVAGTNDTAGHIGSDFYAYHMSLIARTFIAHGIHPTLVSVPEWDSTRPEALGASSAKHNLFRILYDGGQRNVILSYRDALREEMMREHISADVVDFSANYATDYSNQFHLNERGRAKLVAAITAQLRPILEHSAH